MSEYDELWGKPLRLLYFDVETAPKVSYLWDLRVNGYVNKQMLHHDTFLMSWAAKWSDQDHVLSGVLKPAEAKNQDDSRITKSLARLMKQADLVVAHNGDAFDIPIVNARVAFNRLPPLGRVQSIDTLKLARAAFGKGVASKSLEYLADWFGFDGKLNTSMKLWDGAYRGHGPSLKELVAYNRQDVVVLERLFLELYPYAKTLPRLVDFTEYRQDACPYCGSRDRKKTGVHRTRMNNFPKWDCQKCGREYRSWNSILTQKAGTSGL